MRKASEAHRPAAWIMEGGMLCSARQVAPPARILCPATSFWKKRRSLDIKNEWVGIVPFAVSHKGDDTGWRRSRDSKYLIKRCRGQWPKQFPRIITWFPSKKRLALWLGSRNLYSEPDVFPVRGCSALSDVSSNLSLSPLYIPPHRR